MSDNGDDDDYFNEAFGLQHAANSEKTPNLDRDEDGSVQGRQPRHGRTILGLR